MKKYFVIILLFCFSCVSPEKPIADLIPKDTMASILIDIHIAESKVSTQSASADSAYLYYEAYKNEIFNKYKIPPKRFEESFQYYMRNVAEMDQIYAIVVDSLGLREGRGKLD